MFSWGMMIRPDNNELEHVIGIALKTAPDYALRSLISERGMNRQIAVQSLTARVIAALGRYELCREPTAVEMDCGTLPLFPELAEAR